jgi:hypothetical protein
MGIRRHGARCSARLPFGAAFRFMRRRVLGRSFPALARRPSRRSGNDSVSPARARAEHPRGSEATDTAVRHRRYVCAPARPGRLRATNSRPSAFCVAGSRSVTRPTLRVELSGDSGALFLRIGEASDTLRPPACVACHEPDVSARVHCASGRGPGRHPFRHLRSLRSKRPRDVTTAPSARSKLLFAPTKGHGARAEARSPACKARIAGTEILCAVCEADHVATKRLIDATRGLRARSKRLIDATRLPRSVTKVLCDVREADHAATKLRIDATTVLCNGREAAHVVTRLLSARTQALCTRRNERCTRRNERCTRRNERCTRRNERCTRRDGLCTRAIGLCSRAIEPCSLVIALCTRASALCSRAHELLIRRREARTLADERCKRASARWSRANAHCTQARALCTRGERALLSGDPSPSRDFALPAGSRRDVIQVRRGHKRVVPAGLWRDAVTAIAYPQIGIAALTPGPRVPTRSLATLTQWDRSPTDLPHPFDETRPRGRPQAARSNFIRPSPTLGAEHNALRTEGQQPSRRVDPGRA